MSPIRRKGQAQTVGKQDMLRDQRRSQHSPVGRGGSLKGSQLARRTIIDEVGLGGWGHQRGALGRKMARACPGLHGSFNSLAALGWELGAAGSDQSQVCEVKVVT